MDSRIIRLNDLDIRVSIVDSLTKIATRPKTSDQENSLLQVRMVLNDSQVITFTLIESLSYLSLRRLRRTLLTCSATSLSISRNSGSKMSPRASLTVSVYDCRREREKENPVKVIELDLIPFAELSCRFAMGKLMN